MSDSDIVAGVSDKATFSLKLIISSSFNGDCHPSRLSFESANIIVERSRTAILSF